MVYRSDKTLNYLLTDEGMVNKSSGGYVYEYHLKDHLGNVRVTFQPNGTTTTVKQATEYYPFGMNYPQSPGGTNKYLYNGKEKQDDVLSLTALDLYDYGARFYDPMIGRFHIQDRYAEKYMGLTPYQYAANNPLKFIDLNGDSIVVLTAPEGAKGAGHMAMLIQNKEGKWNLWSKNGTNESSGSSGPTNGDDRGDSKNATSYDSPDEFMNSDANKTDKETGEREYTEGILIPATPKEDRKAEEGAKKILNQEYNVITSNCAQTVQSGLRNAGKKDGSPSTATNIVLGAISPLVAKINEKTPNRIYNRIKEQNSGGKIFTPNQKK